MAINTRGTILPLPLRDGLIADPVKVTDREIIAQRNLEGEHTEVCFDFTLCKALSADEEQRGIPPARQRVSGIIGPGQRYRPGPDIALGKTKNSPCFFHPESRRRDRPMQKTLSTLKDKINNALVVDREKSYLPSCHRSIFTDPQLFEFEMKHIFEGNWVFLAHESHLAEPGDYYTLISWAASRSLLPVIKRMNCMH